MRANPNTHYKFGDIILTHVPFTDGSEVKIRPVLIYNDDRDDYLTIKMTSNILQADKLDIILQPDQYNNLREQTLLQIGKIFLLHKKFVVARLGVLNPADRSLLIQRLHNFIDKVSTVSY